MMGKEAESRAMTDARFIDFVVRLERIEARQAELSAKLYEIEAEAAHEFGLGPKQTYLVAAENQDGDTLVKIGRAYDVHGRLRSLQIGSPVGLRLIRTIPFDCEKLMHARFATLRRHGEWFEFHDDMLGVSFLEDVIGGTA